jgi:hypothetical protein
MSGMFLSITAKPVRTGDAKPTGLTQAAGLPKEKVMKKYNHQQLISWSFGVSFACVLIGFSGCDREERAELADQFGEKLIDAIEDTDCRGADGIDGCDLEVVSCTQDADCPEEWICSDYGDEMFCVHRSEVEEDADNNENPGESGEQGPDESMDGPREDDSWDGTEEQWDSFGELADVELSNAQIGGQFGDASLPLSGGILEGFDEGEFTQLELWSEDRMQMIRIEIHGGIGHSFFKSGGQKQIFDVDLDSETLPQSENGLTVIGATCYGDVPFELEQDIPASKVILTTLDHDDDDGITLDVTIEALHPGTDVLEVSFGSLKLTPIF